VTSGIMELMVFPVIYFIWRQRRLNKTPEPTSAGDIDEAEEYITANSTTKILTEDTP